jgi:hypothetical protein
MDVISLSPLATASVNWIDRYGRPVLTVVCRATFELLPGESRLAQEQAPPSEHDNHWDDEPSRSLYEPTDLAPLKVRPEVMLVGSAFAPRGERVRSLRTRLVVGELDKSIDVHGERAWGQDGAPREGQGFAKMALRWERAAGGPGTANPVGVSPDVTDAYGQIVLPNLQAPGLELAGPATFIAPVGYGPIAAGWPERRERLGANGAAILDGAWAKQPLAEDVDVRFFNAAPRDQQVEALRENERIVLENLHPEHARLVTTLPGIRPRAFVEIVGAAPRELAMVGDTLWINTDSALCTLTWRARVPLEGAGGRVFVAMETPGQQLSWEDVDRQRRRARGGVDLRGTMAIEPGSAGVSAPEARGRLDSLPFAKSDGAPVSLPSPPAPPAPRVGGATMDVHSLQQALQGLDAAPSWLHAQPGRAPAAAPSAPIVTPSRAAPPPPAAATPRPPPPPLPAAARPVQAPPEPARPPMMPPAVAAPRPQAPSPPAPAVAPAPVPGPAPRIAAPAAPPASLRARSVSDASPRPIASGSALDASNAAAQIDDRPAPRPPMASRPETPVDSPRPAPTEYVDLIWFDPAGLERARAMPQLRSLFAVEKKGAEAWLDDVTTSPLTREQRAHAAALRALARGRSLDDLGLVHALTDAITSEGAFATPAGIVAGELHFRFDELERLKAMVVALTPLTPADKKLKDLCDAAGDLLRSPWIVSGSGVADSMTARLREAFTQQSRSLPAGYLERTVERPLLEQRHYQKRLVFGGEMIHALIIASGGAAPVPTYLPESVSRQLPLFPSFKACVLAFVTAAQDHNEAHPAALHVIALGRTLPVPGRPPGGSRS